MGIMAFWSHLHYKAFLTRKLHIYQESDRVQHIRKAPSGHRGNSSNQSSSALLNHCVRELGGQCDKHLLYLLLLLFKAQDVIF